MSYRFIRVTDYYGEYLRNYYDRFPDVDQLSYDEQYNHLTNDSIEMVSSYGKYLRKAGIDAMDIVSNAEALQQTWAKEHSGGKIFSFQELIFEQIKCYQPQVVWIDTTKLLNKKWIQKLRNEVPSLKLIVGHICAPYNQEIADSFSFFDIMFTCSPCTANELTEMGVTTQLVYHSFDHSILDKTGTIANNFPETDFVFTGSLLTGYGLHKTRIEYIESIIDSGIDMTIYGNIEKRSRILLKQGMNLTVNLLNNINCSFLVDGIPVLNKYKKHGDTQIKYYSKKLIHAIRPPVFGMDMYKMLSNSKLCFNIHGDIAKKCAGNVRLFEATGIGTCLVTDWKENLSDLFDLDKEIVTYKSVEECIDKVKWLLNNPLEAQKIAKAGQQRTLRDHTIENRVKIIDNALRSKL
ncbi:MAG: glycosyltransferase [Bacteroidetes bacterium]|nr:glycosyltransferase [Bacteroidota bacterium]HET6244986.1 glycosyltransferase [Bacteroidia bacterium]